MKDALKTFGGIVGYIALCTFVLWLSLWVLTILNFALSNVRDTARCTDLGYGSSDVVINYPKFWHGQGYCYGGKATQKGVEL